jgi:hypothetical protein
MTAKTPKATIAKSNISIVTESAITRDDAVMMSKFQELDQGLTPPASPEAFTLQ